MLNFVVVHGHVGRRGEDGVGCAVWKDGCVHRLSVYRRKGACGVVPNRGTLSPRVLISRC